MNLDVGISHDAGEGHVDKQSLTQGNIKKLYEGRVVSSGSSGQLVKVLPEMIKGAI